MNSSEKSGGTVFIVDDEAPIRDSISLLMRSVGLASQAFPDARAFLGAHDAANAGCLVLDVRMPRMNGLDLQQELNQRGWTLPIIFITGHGDVRMAVEAMRAGAVDFLQKPFNDDELIRRVQKALILDLERRAADREAAALRARFDNLTVREREVAKHLLAGAANKVIAIELALSERTVELYRSHIMDKMQARSLAQLVQMLVTLNLRVP